MSEIKNIRDQFISKLENDLSIDQINEIKTDLFGKNGLISSQFKNIGSIPNNDRKKFASDLNQIKDELQNLISNKINEIESKKINEKLEKEKIDITLPEKDFKIGKIHPVSQVIDEISCIFSEIGFSVEEGPDVEDDYNNFKTANADLINKLFKISGKRVIDYHNSGTVCSGDDGNADDINGLINFDRGEDHFLYKDGCKKNLIRDSVLGDIYPRIHFENTGSNCRQPPAT